MKVAIKSVSTDSTGEPTVKTAATVELVGSRLIVTGPPREAAFLRRYQTVAPDGTWHDFTEGKAWIENLPRSLHGSYGWAEPATADATATVNEQPRGGST